MRLRLRIFQRWPEDLPAVSWQAEHAEGRPHWSSPVGGPTLPADRWKGSGMFHVRRRELTSLLGGAATAWPLGAARAQQPAKLPVVGALVIGNIDPTEFWREFRQGLRELGYVEGQNIRFEFRAYSAGRVAFLLTRLAHDRRLVGFVFALFNVVLVIIVVVGISRRRRVTRDGKKLAHATRPFLLQTSVKLEGIEGHVALVLTFVCEARSSPAPAPNTSRRISAVGDCPEGISQPP